MSTSISISNTRQHVCIEASKAAFIITLPDGKEISVPFSAVPEEDTEKMRARLLKAVLHGEEPKP